MSEREAGQIEATVCGGCGQIVYSDGSCPNCGQDLRAPDEAGVDRWSMSVVVSVLFCDRCGRAMDIGNKICPGCGDVCESKLERPEDGPLNRARIEAFSEVMSEIDEAARAVDTSVTMTVMSDGQFINYFTDNELVSEDLLTGLKAATSRMNVNDQDAVRSVETRDAVQEIRRRTAKVGELYDELIGISVEGQLGGLRTLMVAVYRELLNLHRVCFRPFLAVRLEDVSVAQRDLQGSMDRLAILARGVSDELLSVDLGKIEVDSINARLGAFIGRASSYDFMDRPDMAAAFEAGLRGSSTWNDLGDLALENLGGLTVIDAAALPPEQALVLFSLAAELATVDDPMAVKRSAAVLLDLLRRAHFEGPAALSDILLSCDAETEAALAHWLLEQDSILATDESRLSPDGIVHRLTQVYHSLLEGTYRRLTTPFLCAAALLQGNTLTLEEIATADVSTKRDWMLAWLTSEDHGGGGNLDSLALGVSVVLRHGVAHGDLTFDRDGVTVNRRDKTTRAVLSQERLSREDVLDLAGQLMTTCRAMRLALELFRIEFRKDLPVATQPTTDRVVEEAAKYLVGVYGLVKAVVVRDGRSSATIEAQAAAGAVVRDGVGYLPAACGLVTLFGSFDWVAVLATDDQGGRSFASLQPAEVRRWQELPEDERDFAYLRLMHYAVADPRLPPWLPEYDRGFARQVAALLVEDLLALHRLQQQLPLTQGEYPEAVRRVILRLTRASSVVASVDPIPRQLGLKKKLLEAIRCARIGLQDQDRLLVKQRWHSVGRENASLRRGGLMLIDLVKETE